MKNRFLTSLITISTVYSSLSPLTCLAQSPSTRANPPSATAPAATTAPEGSSEGTSSSSRKKGTRTNPARTDARPRREDRGLSEDEESALPMKSKIRYGGEELEVDPD